MEKKTLYIIAGIAAVGLIGYIVYSKKDKPTIMPSVKTNETLKGGATIVNTPTGQAVNLPNSPQDLAFIQNLKKQGYSDQQIGEMYAKRKGIIK